MDDMHEDRPEDNQQSMHSELSTAIRRRPIAVALGTSLEQALHTMDENRIGAILVIDPDTERPRGIFTLQDLLRRVVLKNVDPQRPIDEVMTRNLITMRPQNTAYQAAVTMSRRNVRHIVVTDHSGRLMGIVSQNDLYALQRAGVKEISIEIRDAQDLSQLQSAAAAIRRLTITMLRQGTGAEYLTHFISTLNDLLTLRILEMTEAEFELPQVEWCWIAMGSEGRFEQTFTTDQDNGIVFAAEAGKEQPLREQFLPFALEVNRRLDACGFPLCKGNIMASNPQWCLSLREWKDKFSTWINRAEPEALLNASIFFDFRPLYGDEQLAESLSSWLLNLTSQAALFVRMMVTNALQVEPPLGFIRDFVYDESKEFPHTIDLKMHGVRTFVDAARVLALAYGVSQTNTAQRLRAAGEKFRMKREEIQAALEAFYFIQSIRMRHQIDVEQAGSGSPNRINPDEMNEVDRHMLKESFKQARKFQQRLQVAYHL
ncbi:MAG: CBS domain-containing protein [Rhodocyclaceae bacterium]|nr:CBS domain-containing protein [Rhodocyclaceae bacterium]MBX3668580.1 CBS domain-containing protein [Rhodocyclaceae bacterium]